MSDLSLAERADELAASFRFFPKRTRPSNRTVLRDYIHHATGGELDSFQLDMLTDMVAARIDPAVHVDDDEGLQQTTEWLNDRDERATRNGFDR